MQRLSYSARVVSCTALFLAIASIAQAISVTLATPAANNSGGYATGASIAYSGSFTFAAGESVLTAVEMYSLTGSDDPTKGTIASSVQARLFNYSPPDGSGNFDSQNVTPALTALTTGKTDFYVTAAPVHANGYYYPNGRSSPPYYTSAAEKTN